MSTLHYALAELIWRTSRGDEGTISAIGANHVASAILASNLLTHPAPEAGEARLSEAEVALPAGETRIEWGVICDHDRSPWRVSEEIARGEVAQAISESCRPRVVSRTVTSFPDVVGEWAEVAGDE